MTAEPEVNGRPVLPPLQLTTARWKNRKRRGQLVNGEPCERWSKVLAHQGSYEQFSYGTNTPSDWDGPLQRAIICAPQSGLIAVDVDDEQAYLGTRTGQMLGRAQALTTRGPGFHILIDARMVPAGDWPGQGPIAGADIKSRGFIPFPGSQHYSGELYELADIGGGRGQIIPATPELVAAIRADRADHDASRRAAGGNGNGNGGGNGGGHDGELAAAVLSMVRRGLDREACHAEWARIAVPRDPGWPFGMDDFERHYRGAVAKARETTVANEQAAQAVAPMLAGSGQPAAAPFTCKQAEAVYAKWLQDDDPVPTRVVLATYAANMALEGDPVWLMLVGGSGVGKTERISPVSGMPRVVMASTLTGEAALLSASPKRERASNATGGVLRQVGERGVLVVKDFTSVLSMSRDRRSEVIAALREVYDGRWDRHYGTDGGQVLTWEGKCGFIAGCTTAIDGAHSVLDAMGTRFLFVRMPDADLDRIGAAALRSTGYERQMRAELAEATTGLLANLGQPHDLHGGVSSWLLPLANLASQGRSPVEYDFQGDISLVLDAEAPTRLIKQLGQLWRACGMLGLDEAHSWEAVKRAGLDSIPKLRRAVLTYLAGCQHDSTSGKIVYAARPQSTTSVSDAAGHPKKSTRRALDALTAHGIVDRFNTGTDTRPVYEWALSKQALTWWDALHR